MSAHGRSWGEPFQRTPEADAIRAARKLATAVEHYLANRSERRADDMAETLGAFLHAVDALEHDHPT